MLAILMAGSVWNVHSWSAPAAKGGLVEGGRVLVVGARPLHPGTRLFIHASADGGRSWKELGVVTQDENPRADLGDGNLVRLRDGRLLCTFRRNDHQRKRYAIEVAESRDKGRTWTRHSTVERVQAEGPGPSRGLWAPFLLITGRNEIQCYYDDEHLPWKSGASGHQWIVMRAWRGGRWSTPTVVAREPKGLSRDGMASVVDLGRDRLLCAVEAVETESPHNGLLRGFVSSDGGKSWTDPETLYAPKTPFHAFAPSLLKVDGKLILLFATNEDRKETLPTGNPPEKLGLDIKSIVSNDGGKSWSPPTLVYGGTHRNYLPSIVSLGGRRLLATFIDFDKGTQAVQGHL